MVDRETVVLIIMKGIERYEEEAYIERYKISNLEKCGSYYTDKLGRKIANDLFNQIDMEYNQMKLGEKK